jgi:hypothetical protein
MSDPVSEFANSCAIDVAIECLIAPWPNYNEGQKVLIKDYTSIDSYISVYLDADVFGPFVVLSAEVISDSFDVEGYVEEAFGSLYDDTEMIVKEFIDDAFNFDFEGLLWDPILDFIDNFGDAVLEARRRIAVFS